MLAAIQRGSGVVRPDLDDGALGRLFDADLLVGACCSSSCLGVMAGRRFRGASLMYISFPPVTGFMLIDSPLSGQKGAFASAVSHLILPSIVLATILLAVIARQTRSAMLWRSWARDCVRTARARGLSPARVIGVHALRNAMIPVITTIGLQIGVLLAGAILTETIFFLARHRQVDDRFDQPPRLSGGAGGCC